MALLTGTACHRQSGSSAPSPASEGSLWITLTIASVPGDTATPVHLRLDIAATSDSINSLRLPSEWAGRTELFRNVVDLASATPGVQLIQTDGPDRVRIAGAGRRPFAITWRLKGTVPSWSARDAHNHSDIGRGWVQLVGYDALVLPDVDRGTPVRATLVFAGVPDSAPIATSFGARHAPGDSIIVAHARIGDLEHALYTFGAAPGAVRLWTSSIAGRRLIILVRGRLSIPDSILAGGVQQVVAAERTFWGGPAPDEYVVSIGVAPRGTLAGTRLTNTFVADIDSTRTMDAGVIGLFAHELMHEWIGGTIHPAPGIADGELAWFMEGFTDFTARRTLRTSHLLTDSSYVAAINHVLLEHETSTARDSGWAAIVSGFWRNGAMQREPYLRGEMLALQLDALIRRDSRGRDSLDETLHAMVSTARTHPSGVTADNLITSFSRGVRGEVVRQEVDSAIAGGPITLPPDALGPCGRATIEQRATWDPGFDVDASLAAHATRGVRPGGPAHRAGLRDSMVIVGTNIWRGDPSKMLELRVRADSGTASFRFLPAGPTVDVQQWRLAPDCSP
jgi:predicted metalloprotease with PDZ domain